MDLLPSDVEKYSKLFAVPEQFPEGQWRVTNYVEETPGWNIVRMVSSWEKKPVCPFCHKPYTSPPALSRTDNKTLCCPDCGVREALMAASIPEEKIEEIIAATHEAKEKEE